MHIDSPSRNGLERVVRLILRLIRSLDSNKARGCDNISVSMIKSVMTVLSNHCL